MKRWSLLLAVVFVMIWGPGARAAPVAISNPGFEAPAMADGAFVFSAPGWSTFGGVGAGVGTYNPTTLQYAAEAPEGENVAFMVVFNSAGLAQTLPTQYQAGQTYTLTARVGDRDDYAQANFVVALFAGGVQVSQGGATPDPPDGEFSVVTATFAADQSVDGLPIEIRLLATTSGDVDPDQDPGNGGTALDVDDVALDASPTAAAVPGLGTGGAMLLLAALGGLGLRSVAARARHS